MPDLIGYARVSTADQNLDKQIDALDATGCARVFSEHASGVKSDRPQLAAALDYMREGDILVVERLDRLGRNVSGVLDLVTRLQDRGVQFRSLAEGFDPSTPLGRAMLTVASAFAEMEHALMLERTHAGLAAARARGRVGGRPRQITDRKIAVIRQMHAERDSRGAPAHTVAAIAETVGVSRRTVYRYLD